MKYTNISIPTVFVFFIFGMTGFLGLGSFCANVFGSDIAGYIGGCIGFVTSVFCYYHLGKMNYKLKNKEG